MVSRNYDDNEYRRNPPFARNEPIYGVRNGRGEGEHAYPPQMYGRELYAPEDRYPQRVDYGYRDSDHLSRGGSGDAFRGYEGQENYGYGAGERDAQGCLDDGYAPGSRGGARGDRRAYGRSSQWGSQGLRSDGANMEQYQRPYGQGAQEEGEQSRQFEPDYHQWRNEQLSVLDADYQAWRGERYKKFASEFNQWRSGRLSPGEESKSKGSEKENANKNK